MRYVEIELEDGLAEKLENVAEEDGLELEDLIVGILEDDVGYDSESVVSDDDEYTYGVDDVDTDLDPFGNTNEFE